MYVIKSIYNSENFYFVSKDVNKKFNLPIMNYSNDIKKATKFYNLDIAISELKKLVHCNFSIYPVCPICNQDYSSYPAISRKDNKTEICPECGIREALEKYIQT
jgi:hypothetical protein